MVRPRGRLSQRASGGHGSEYVSHCSGRPEAVCGEGTVAVRFELGCGRGRDLVLDICTAFLLYLNDGYHFSVLFLRRLEMYGMVSDMPSNVE